MRTSGRKVLRFGQSRGRSLPKKSTLNALNRVGETLYMIRPQLERALGNMRIEPSVQAMTGGAKTYLEYWKAQLNDRFFDMANFVRLGSEVERAFRDFYMERKGHTNLVDLRTDPTLKGKGNIFQRVKPTSKDNLQLLFEVHISVKLDEIPTFSTVKEFLIHRHLYAHNSGLVDEQYFDDLRQTCGIDLLADGSFVGMGFPKTDVYYFDPLTRLGEFLEAIKKTIHALPWS